MPLDDTQIQNDGSLEAAALAMPDIEPMPQSMPTLKEAQAQQLRDENNGQWTTDEKLKRRQANEADAQPKKAEQPALDGEVLEPEGETSEIAEEWFEIPAEKDGEKPTRLKAEDVFKGYQETQRLRAELDEARRIQPMPEEYDNIIMSAVQQRAALMRTLQMYQARLQPVQPDFDLINEDSPKYNPGLYHRQAAAAQRMASEMQQLRDAMTEYESEQRAQMEALTQARVAREISKLHQFWPEVRDKAVASRVRDDLVAHYGKYGVTPELIASVHNAAFYALAKDALAYRQGLKAQEQAVKVVRAKPKMVRSTARDTQAPTARRSQAAMARLKESGSLDDAADAMSGLL